MCDEVLQATDDDDVIMSPLYPKSYPDYVTCKYKIKSSNQKHILITFGNFTLGNEKYENCESKDYVKITSLFLL